MSKPVWTQKNVVNGTHWLLEGSQFFIVKPNCRAEAKLMRLPDFAKYAIFGEPSQSYLRGYTAKLSEAKQRVLELSGMTITVKLLADQKRSLKQWQSQGYSIKSTRKRDSEQAVEVELEKRESWDFPEWCPYALPKWRSHQLTIVISKHGNVRKVDEMKFSGEWACDYPQGTPYEPPTRIYAGTHPLIPIGKMSQLGLPLE